MQRSQAFGEVFMTDKTAAASESTIDKLIDIRGRFRSLLLQNPNYFGNLEQSQLKAILPIQSNTAFEEIGCVGYQPQTNRLEATVYVKQAGGYGGGLCGPGSYEYVRFYASWNNGTSWTDLGLSSVNVWDIPDTSGKRRLEYAVTRRHDFSRRPCFAPQIVLIRAILSWNVVPPPNTPKHIPVWGEVHNTRILIEPRRYWLVKELFDTAGLQIKPELAAILDENAQIPVAAKALPAQAHQLQAASDVPLRRLAHAQLSALQDSPFLPTHLEAAVGSNLQAAGLNFKGLDLAALFGPGDGNTSYEQLESVGYDPVQDNLVGIIRVKQSSGYSGGPCSNGSLENVTFWADLNNNGTFETCLGTASVRVYDVTIPEGGLEYAVHLPANLLRHRIPCQEGARIIPIRAILSWTTAIPCATPNATPHWGNREETLVHVLPGRRVGDDELQPVFSSAGGIPVGNIDGNGFAQNAVAVTTGSYFNNAPFGGRINLAGKIINGSSGTRYRVMIRKHNVGAFAPLNLDPNGFPQTVVTWPGPVTTTATVHVGPDGYYGYQDYSANHYVEGNILAVWQTGAGEHGSAYDLRIDIKDPGNPLVDIKSNVVTVEVDNEAPVLNLEFTSLAGDCAHFDEDAVFQGKFSVLDPHFGGFSFQILPNGPAHGVLPTPPSGASIYLAGGIADPGIVTTFELNTAGVPPSPGMDPCGYALVLHASDRTNVNSGAHNNNSSDSIGFCLGSPPEG
jgi:hypothetical protein